MRVDPDVRLILYGVGSALSLASLVGFILRARVRQIAAIGIVENLNTRIKAWWGIVLVGSAALFAGRTAVIALFATISFLALREFLTVTEVEAADHRAILACFLVMLPSQYLLVEAGWYGSWPATAHGSRVLARLQYHPRRRERRDGELLHAPHHQSPCRERPQHLPAIESYGRLLAPDILQSPNHPVHRVIPDSRQRRQSPFRAPIAERNDSPPSVLQPGSAANAQTKYSRHVAESTLA